MIDRSLHQVWIGKELPMRFKEWTARMKKMNSDLEYHFWGNEVLDQYADDPYVAWMLATNERTAFLVDRLRVLLLRDHGGIYCDVDCYAIRPFRTLNELWFDERIDFVAGLRPPDRLGVSLNAPGISFADNTVLASAKDGRMINRLCKLYRPSARKHTGFSAGREILRNAGPDTCLLNWRYFYAEQDNEDAIVLHDSHNLASWNKPKKLNATNT